MGMKKSQPSRVSLKSPTSEKRQSSWIYNVCFLTCHFFKANVSFPDRMPHFIGNFLSERMYDDALGTTHANGSNVCCRFVDVATGWQEKGEDGNSWIVSKLL